MPFDPTTGEGFDQRKINSDEGIAKLVRDEVLKEREACAKIAEGCLGGSQNWDNACRLVADEIRKHKAYADW